MAEWSRNKVNSSDLNNGNEFNSNDRVARQELNAIVNAGLYAQDFAEHLADTPDTSEVNNVGTPSVSFVDSPSATTDKPYKRFKFANLKGAQGVGVTNISSGTATTSGEMTTTPVTFTLSNNSTQTINVYAQKGEAGQNGTTINVNNIPQSSVNFDSDPQTQLNEKLDKSGGEVSGDVTINNGNGIVLEPSSAGQTYNAFKFYAQGDDVYVEKQKVEGGADYQKILPLDSELSLTSINAVQNNVVTEALNDKAGLSQNNTFTGNQSFTGDVNIKSLKQSDDFVWGTLYGNGAPTTTTVGAVGQLYIDITNDKMYVCVQFDFPSYVWKEVAFVDNAKLLNKIYPIGSIYISVNQTSPASFIGGTWTPLEAGRTLWTTTTVGQGGTMISAGLPNIEGSLESVVMARTWDSQPYSTGALSFGNSVLNSSGAGDGWWTYLKPLYFNANDDNDIYGNSTTVQPPAYRVYMWRRTA